MSVPDLPTDATPQGVDQGIPATTVPATNEAAAPDPFRWWHNELPILGSLWGIFLTVVLLGILQVQLYKHTQFLLGAVTLVVFLLVLHVGGRVNLVYNIRYRPLRSALWVLAYILAGTAWIFGFWTFEVRKAANHAVEVRTQWRKDRGYTATEELPEAAQVEWKAFVKANPQIFEPPTYKDRRAELAWRGLLWPVSMPYELLSEWLSELWVAIVDAIGGTLDRIGKWWFQGVTD